MLIHGGKPWASDTIHPHSIQQWKDLHFSFGIGSKMIRLVFESWYVVERIQCQRPAIADGPFLLFCQNGWT